MRPVVSPGRYIYTPPIVPQTSPKFVKTPQIHHENLCKKSSPRPPLGGLGERPIPNKRCIDGGKTIGYHTAQAQATPATAPRTTATRRRPERREGMTTPTQAELLVKEAKNAERLEIMAMAEKAKTIEDFRKALEVRHNASK